MGNRAESGFSLVELIVALLLASAVAAITHRVLLVHRRVSENQVRRAENEATLREAAAIIRSELRALSPADSTFTDVHTLSPSSVVYAATRTLTYLCAPPDTLDHVVTARRASFGLRDLNPAVDSVMLLVLHHRGESWVRASVSRVSTSVCADGTSGIDVHLTGASSSELADVSPSSPLLGFEIAEIRSYRDGQGQWWIGMRRYQKDRGVWPAIQPAVGPLAPGGLTFEFLTASGGVAGAGREVHLIRAEVAVEQPPPRPGLPSTRRVSVIQVFPRGGHTGGLR